MAAYVQSTGTDTNVTRYRAKHPELVIPADDPIYGDRCVSAETVARFLGRSYERTVKAAKDGDLPGVKIAGHWYFSAPVIRHLVGME